MVQRSAGQTSKRPGKRSDSKDRNGGEPKRTRVGVARLNLNLGCGDTRKEGFRGIDVEPGPEVDQIVDLNILPWPWDDNSIDGVYAGDALEHLAPLGIGQGQNNIVAVMREIHRVLKPGGELEILVPSTDGRGAFQDPSHRTFWNKNTFLYFSSNQEFAYMTKFSIGYPRFKIHTLLNVDGDLLVSWVHVTMTKPE